MITRKLNAALVGSIILLAAACSTVSAKRVYVRRASGSVSGLWQSGDYVVDSTVTVEKGDTLHIMPGVRVLMGGNYTSFKVNGVLLAEGTPQDPVKFISSKSQTAAWDWDRIHFSEGGESFMRCCIVRQSNYGIYCDGASVTLINCLLDSNSIHGIYASNGSVQAVRTTVCGRNNLGVFADAASRIELDECQVHGNLGGLGCDVGGRLFAEKSMVTRNVLGLATRKGAAVQLVDSKITGNKYGLVSDFIDPSTVLPGIQDNGREQHRVGQKALARLFVEPVSEAGQQEEKPEEKIALAEEEHAGGFKATRTTAQKMSSKRPYANLSFAYQNWSKTMTSEEQYQELSTPLNVYIPFTNNFKAIVGMAFADARRLDQSANLTGINDLRVQAVYVGMKDRLLIMGGVNIPTGKNKLTTEESELAVAISDEDLLFNIKRLGEGPGVNVSFAFSNKITANSRFAIGAGYYLRGKYDRLSDITSEYNPGDVIVTTGGIDINVRKESVLRTDVSYTFFTPEYENDEQTYKEGGMIGAKVSLITHAKKLGWSIGVSELYRMKVKYANDGELVEEQANSYGNRIGGDAAVQYAFTEKFALNVLVDIDSETPNGYDKSSELYSAKKLLAGFGGGADIALSKRLLLNIGARYYRGSIGSHYRLLGGIELSGFEVESKVNVVF